MFKSLLRPQRYLLISLAAALLAALLRSLAILLAFEGNYFSSSPLAILQSVVSILLFLAVTVLPLAAPKEVLPLAQDRADHTVATKATAALVALCLLLCFISACTVHSTLGLPFLLALIAFPSLLAGMVYFILHFFKARVSETVTTVFGSLLLFALASLVCFTYFDIGTQMNAPHKVSQHLALLALMLYLLYDMRATARAPRPRAQAASTGAALFLCTTNGISNIIGFIAGKYASSLFFATDLLLFVFALYIIARSKDVYRSND